MPTLRGFARDHGLAPSTWQREFNRGRTGGTQARPGESGPQGLRPLRPRQGPGRRQV